MPKESFQCVVMFADVVGSTAMYEKMGDTEARDRISKALNTLISICRRHKGHLVKTIGDEIMVYFRDVDLSLMAAQSIQEAMEDDRSPQTVGISIKIGMHFGSVILDNNDIFGDTVNVAARVAAIAKSRQILYSGVLADRIMTADLNERTRKFDRVDFKGKQVSFEIFQLLWEEEGEVTDMLTGEMFAIPAKVEQAKKLLINFQSQSIELDISSKAVFFGRDKICDFLVSGPLISRVHNKIAVQRGKFMLVDQSTNGTYVSINGEQNVYLRREELALYGQGLISFGRPVTESGDNVIKFYCS